MVQSTENLILGFFDASGNLISGADAKTGAALTAAQVRQIAQQAQGQQGVGNPAIIAIAAVAGLAVVGAATYFIVQQWADKAKVAAREATTQSVISCVQSGQCPPAMVNQVQQNQVAQTQADTANRKADPFADSLAQAANAVMWLAIGGIGVAGLVAVAPAIKGAVEHMGRKENPISRKPYPSTKMLNYGEAIQKDLRARGLSPLEAMCVVRDFDSFIVRQMNKRVPAASTAHTLANHPEVRARCARIA